jgi:nucleoside-diphosphate-sugar epimerase
MPEGLLDAQHADRPLSGMRALVTGAAGFLGSHLCEALHAAGCQVVAVTRREPPPGTPFDWVRADCADLTALREAVRHARPEIVYHLAGSGVGEASLGAIMPTVHGDLLPCLNILTVAAEFGCGRLILAASLEEPVGAEGVPASPYAAAKWASSMYARMFDRLFGLPVALVRPFMTYGPRQRRTKVIPSVMLALVAGRRPELGSGTRLVDWVYVDDVIQAMIKAARQPGIEGQILDLGSGVPVSIRSVVERIVAISGSPLTPNFNARPDRPHEMIRVADAAATAEKLGWRASTTLDAGLEQTLAWYRANA